MKSRMRRQRILSHSRVLEPLIAFIKHYAILGDEHAAIESSCQHRIEEMAGDGRIAIEFRTRQRRDRTRNERKRIRWRKLFCILSMATGYNQQRSGQRQKTNTFQNSHLIWVRNRAKLN